jgi:putative addiction module component (TIGR02574 family)
MILEKLPAVQQLTPTEQSQLVEELWERWLPRDDEPTNAAIVELLQARLEHFRQHPESAVTWDEVKQRIERLRQCRK